MFQHQNVWLPDGEKHFPEWMDKNGELVDGRGTYQIRKWRACLPHIKQFRVAVDVGAHVGLWSMQMVKHFRTVCAFEPVQQFRECYQANLDGHNVLLYHCALGAQSGRVAMKIPLLESGLDTGGTHVVPGDEVEMRTLDEFDFNEVDFLKVDCEGYELEVLKGAKDTLVRCRPCVIVEQKPHKLGPNFGIQGTPAVDFLRELGAVVRQEISGDFILSWE